MLGQASFARLRACFDDTFLDEDRLLQEEHPIVEVTVKWEFIWGDRSLISTFGRG